MNKKAYIKPSAEVIEIDVISMIAASAENITIGGDGQGGGDALSNNRRGEWGNLWNSDK